MTFLDVALLCSNFIPIDPKLEFLPKTKLNFEIAAGLA